MPAAPPLPTRLGEYEIVGRLGAGGMAEVFLAKKRGAADTYKQLVVKRVLPLHGQSGRFRQMFISEATLATRLNHPNIVQVFDFQDIGDEGQLLAMEYVEGPDLGKIMSAARAKGQKLPFWVSAYIIAEAGKGLHYAHERKDDDGKPLGIVHRDVSPQNILVSFDGAVKIADFGIASANMLPKESGVLKGKFGYMSPEQARGDTVDRRSDIYALGVCLYELLAARSLHGSLDGEDLLEQVRKGKVDTPKEFVREIPDELEAVVLKALAKNPDDRFQTARDLAGAIGRGLMAQDELIDATQVEGAVGRLVERDASGEPGRSTSGQSDVAEFPTGSSTRDREHTKAGPNDGGTASDRKGAQEVRHVAVVTVRLFGIEELEGALGRTKSDQTLTLLRKTLGEVAFKHGAEWMWDGDEKARAVVGLLANSSRAAAEAAWLAVDTHDSLGSASEDLPVALRAGIGIVRGIATGERAKDGRLKRHALQSPADTLASILGGQAPAGATWVAGGLYRMVRRDFRWGDAPTIQIEQQPGKPLPRVMRVYALERPLSQDERVAELALAPSDLVGRDAEKADLHVAYHRAAATGAAGIVSRAVLGEMGIGKSALVTTFLTELPEGARVLRADASQGRMEIPYGFAADVLRSATGLERDTPVEDAHQALESLLGQLGTGAQAQAMLGPLADLVAGVPFAATDEEELSYRAKLLGAGMRRVFASLAARQPLVFVAENLHWADKQSLGLVSDLLRRRDALPVLAVLVARAEERVLPYLDGIVRVDLRGLSHEEQIRLVEARLGVHEGVAAVCADLSPRVAGNPFFLLEMIDALLERGALELHGAPDGSQSLVRTERLGEAGELPSTLEQIIGDRLRELPPEERAIVDWLAVGDGALSTPEIASLLGESVEDAVTRLCARGLCDLRGGILDFRHTIGRDVAYGALPAEARKRMHRALGLHLAGGPLAVGLSAAMVARHLQRGGALVEAAALYLEAANAARNGYQLGLAIKYYSRALSQLPDDDTRRFDAHDALEALYRITGKHRDRRAQLVALRAVARQTREPRHVAVALARSARLDLDDGNLTHGIELAAKAAQAARAVGTRTLIVEAEAIVSELHRELGDLQSALSACDRALAVASGGSTVPMRARAEILRTRGTILRRMGRVTEAVEAHAEAIAIFKRTNARRQEARARNALAYCMIVSERWEDAIALAMSSVSIDLSIGGRFQIAKTLANVGLSYARLGDMSRANGYLRRAREAHERYGDHDSRADTLLVSAEVMLEMGDVDAAASFCTEASAIVGVTSSAYDSSHERVVKALIARRRGDLEAAAAHAYQARAQAERHGLVSFHLYASAIEGAARVDRGEPHVGALLAATAFSSAENIPTEYGLEIRALAVSALDRAGSPTAIDTRERTTRYVTEIDERIRDPRLRQSFRARAIASPFLPQHPLPQQPGARESL